MGAGEDGSMISILDDVYKRLRGSNNLVFANSKSLVERAADYLRRKSEEQRAPNEFFPHHGNLSRDFREDAEERLRENEIPSTVICTTTLEMGIDIGSIASVAQIGAPPSTASLRQRMGRSGRAGGPAILRIYVQEREIDPMTPPQDTLRPELFQSVAMVSLLLKKWLEPPRSSSLGFSTLIQQTLSIIAERGGIQAGGAWKDLCGPGPFSGVSQSTYAKLLRVMGEKDLLLQAGDGVLLPGALGERIINHFSFYVIFPTPEEYRILSSGRLLGSIPIDRPISAGGMLIFAGKRWRIDSIDDRKREIAVNPAKGGRPPKFCGSAGSIHGAVRKEMFELYRGQEIPAYLDPMAAELLLEGRKSFIELGLEKENAVKWGENTLLFPWSGDMELDSLCALLKTEGIMVSHDGIAVEMESISIPGAYAAIKRILDRGPVDAIAIARRVVNKSQEKYDSFLSEELLCMDYASRYLDIPAAMSLLRSIYFGSPGR